VPSLAALRMLLTWIGLGTYGDAPALTPPIAAPWLSAFEYAGEIDRRIASDVRCSKAWVHE
jgi:hypothetical protein